MAAPDAELAESLHAMKGALNKAGNTVSQIAKQMNDAKNRGQPLPFSEADHAGTRHLAGMVLDFADEVALMADGRPGDRTARDTCRGGRLAGPARRRRRSGAA